MTIFYYGTNLVNRINAKDVFPFDEPIAIYGYGGDDVIKGAFLHENTIYGGSGNDDIRGGCDKNIIYGDAGSDVISCWIADDLSSIYGGAGNDTLTGGNGGNILDGGKGNDTLTGGEGGDTYVIDSALDVINETYTPYWDNDPNPSDLVQSYVSFTLTEKLENLALLGKSSLSGTGNSLNNVVTGNSASNILSGAAGADSLIGNAGNDILVGGLGRDTLTGGAGADRFRYTALNEKGDTITDFVRGSDKLQFVRSGFGNLTTSQIAHGHFFSNSTGKASGAAAQFIFNTRTGALVYDKNGSATGGATTIAALNVRTLSANDFLMVSS